jgi:hypothetical protein
LCKLVDYTVAVYISTKKPQPKTATGSSADMPKHVSFYDESLKTQIEGSYTTDGKSIHAGSGTLGFKSAPYGHLGLFMDKPGQDLLAQKLLSELARHAAKSMSAH